MPIYRNRSGKKITKLYVDEIRLLHSTKDLLADLTLNNPSVVAYARVNEQLTKVCNLWPIPEPKGKKAKAEYTAAEMADSAKSLAAIRAARGEPIVTDTESEARPESPTETAASMEARACDPRTT